MIYLLYLTLLCLAEVSYFKIADRYNIIDKPNHRSSHSEITIRGGGIVFCFAVFLWFVFSGFQYPLFVGGLFIISVVSFIDDISSFSRRARLVAQLVAVFLVFMQLHLFSLSLPLVVLFFILLAGVINAYNFMDGINGITGAYSLVVLLSLLWVNNYHIYFIDNQLLLSVSIALAIFNFFNFRKKAVCFAGDVGSISIAFIICFLLIKLITQAGDARYLLLLAVYGVDALITITLRLFKGENIFLPHRSHLYQLLVNERKYPHLLVASSYALVQLVINYALIKTIKINEYQIIIIFLIILIFFYTAIRVQTSKRQAYKNI